MDSGGSSQRMEMHGGKKKKKRTKKNEPTQIMNKIGGKRRSERRIGQRKWERK